jgi:hypothetical protein
MPYLMITVKVVYDRNIIYLLKRYVQIDYQMSVDKCLINCYHVKNQILIRTLLGSIVIIIFIIVMTTPNFTNNTLDSVYGLASETPFPRILNVDNTAINSNNDSNKNNNNTSNIAMATSNETSSSLEITTDKKTYKPGEIITITVRNNGKQPLAFPDAALGLKIENLDTGERFGLMSAQVLTTVEPGQSQKIEWDQKGNIGNQVIEGSFNAAVTTAPGERFSNISAGTEFQIRK